jgi:hypothetical protein
MKKILFLYLFCLVSLLYGQTTSVTNNNTITIQGNVYYFQPSNTPSSPLPTVGNNDFIGTGSWYGENAARAWASISDWAIERCQDATSAVRGSNNERVYISQVHAFRPDTPEYRRHNSNYYYTLQSPRNIGGIIIYYWIVPNGRQMEDGRRAYRSFRF